MRSKIFYVLFAITILLTMWLRARYDNIRAMKTGVILNRNGLWIGAHYSPYNKRWCINFFPCVTWWIVKEGGNLPDKCRLKPRKIDIEGGKVFADNADMMITIHKPKNTSNHGAMSI